MADLYKMRFIETSARSNTNIQETFNTLAKSMYETETHIGNVPKNTTTFKSLWLVYGDCFCADREIYERIKDTISNGITSIPSVEFTETNELGKVKKVVQVLPTDDFKVYVYFEDGKIKLFDMSHLVGNRDQYECLDIDPFTIYEEGADVSDPLAS